MPALLCPDRLGRPDRPGRLARLAAVLLVSGCLAAPSPVFARTEQAVPQPVQTEQAKAAALPALQLPARSIPVPETVSPDVQADIARGYPDGWLEHPLSMEEYAATVLAPGLQGSDERILSLAEHAAVSVEEKTIGGVRVYAITPKQVAPEKKDMLLLHVHGGGYVFYDGLVGAGEAIYMAHYSGIPCLSIDYRLAPQHPYPAGLDDCMAVYKAILQTKKPSQVGLFGTSAGGSMILSMALRARMENLPLPGALVPATPWADISKVGDSYYTNEGLDTTLVRYEGWVGDAAKVYAPGHDLKDPLISPVYGDFAGFPPTLLIAGTRDLFLSNTVRVHAKMLQQGVDARLIVHEALSHAQYLHSFTAPETVFHFTQMGRFFAEHLR